MSRRNVPANDNISRNIEDKVPDHLQGNDKFVDIINWNIKFFSARNRPQAEIVKRIMQELNSDIFVLQEIEPGSLEPVAEFLNDIGAGAYKTAYDFSNDSAYLSRMIDTVSDHLPVLTRFYFIDEDS
jgi:endonuclease/exonuclease/phosphatase family metal-dependent hydrolase